MKDLGELLGLAIDSNQRRVKDPTEEFETGGGYAPKKKPRKGGLFDKLKRKLAKEAKAAPDLGISKAEEKKLMSKDTKEVDRI